MFLSSVSPQLSPFYSRPVILKKAVCLFVLIIILIPFLVQIVH